MVVPRHSVFDTFISSGLDDSRNTALLAWKMIRDGCLMKITRSLNKVLTKKNPKILARNLGTDQVEEAATCNMSIQGPSIYQKELQSTVNAEENAQMNSVCVNSSLRSLSISEHCSYTGAVHTNRRDMSFMACTLAK